MKLSLFLLLPLVAFGQAIDSRGGRSCQQRTRNGMRMATCLPGYETFDLAPADGEGMGAECACTAIRTAQGAAVTFARASSASCIKTDGTGVTCTSNLPVVETRDTVKGFKIEAARTNGLLRSDELDDAAWTSTATVTANAYTGPWGATMEKLDDTDGAASQGTTQTYTTAYGSDQYWMLSCWLRSDTVSTARLQLAGTGATAGDRTCTFSLTATPTRYACISGAYTDTASGTAITGSILVGTLVGDTGTIGAGSCQLERGSFGANKRLHASSYIPTTTAVATRANATATVPLGAGLSEANGCHSFRYYTDKFTNGWGSSNWYLVKTDVRTILLGVSAAGSDATENDVFVDQNDGTTTVSITNNSAARTDRWGGARVTWSGSARTVQNRTSTLTTNTGAYDGALGMAAGQTLSINNGTGPINGLLSRIQFGTNPAGCGI